MDAGTTHLTEFWLMRMGENIVRTAMVALVLTGQMLPAGSVSAEDGPLPPSLATPGQPPEPPMSEAVTPESSPAVEPMNPDAAAADPLPMVVPGLPPSEVTVQSGMHTLGDWKMIIRPGIVPAKPAPRAPAVMEQAPIPQTSLSVPVTVNVNQIAGPYPLVWSVPATYSGWWNAPTSAYLFQRPRPYWQLRGDFHHLAPFISAPFISGLWD